jgi:uracil-DNA glycosylase family 4
MFTGDSSGDWLYDALHRYRFANQREAVSREDGLKLTDCYITAAARCAPPGNRPTQSELDTCQPFLEAELGLLGEARVYLVLGHVAHRQWLRAAGWWKALAPSARPSFGHGKRHALANGTWLLCSYHPSRQNTNTGRLTRRMWHSVFRAARKLLD